MALRQTGWADSEQGPVFASSEHKQQTFSATPSGEFPN